MSERDSERETVGELLLRQTGQNKLVDLPHLRDDGGNIHIDGGNIHIDNGNIHIDGGNIHINGGNIHIDGGNIHIDGSLSDKNSEEKLASPAAVLTSSCQALRHAVSALTCIDDFLLEELGAGFFANVYKATHRVTGKEMVMKINKDYANRFGALREIQLMNRLSHPNILRFLGVCVHEGQLHALTEYISGGTLEDLLANKEEELPWILRIKLALDICEGLHYLHSQGVFHRDLTSRNVLIKKGENRNYLAVIADFGLAMQIPDSRSTEPLLPVGCPWWMAPEVIHGQFYDERADVFSLGIILLEITARIEADPETMPRTRNFGVDYVKVCDLVEYCPLDFLQLAFKCCQILPECRPSSNVIQITLEKIYRNLNLQNDTISSAERLRKRSKSEDNILQMSDSFTDVQGEETYITAQIVAQAMTKDDPHYCPATVNPFADLTKFKDGRKLHEIPQRKCSGHNCCLCRCVHLSSQICECWLEKQQSQSLPGSPIMLRRAAERLHLASLLGSQAVRAEDQQDLHVSVSSDNQTDSQSPAALARRAQFHTSRTRSLGSLDFWSPGHGAGAAGRGRGNKCRFYPNHSQTGRGGSFTAEVTNSFYEGEFVSELSSCMDDTVHEEVLHSACSSNVNCCLAEGSQDILLREVEVLGCPVSQRRCSDSPSASSLSSIVSCGDIVQEEDTLEIFPDSPVPLNSEPQHSKSSNSGLMNLESSNSGLMNHESSNNKPQSHESPNNKPQNHESSNKPQNHESPNNKPQSHESPNNKPQNHESVNNKPQNHESPNNKPQP